MCLAALWQGMCWELLGKVWCGSDWLACLHMSVHQRLCACVTASALGRVKPLASEMIQGVLLLKCKISEVQDLVRSSGKSWHSLAGVSGWLCNRQVCPCRAQQRHFRLASGHLPQSAGR